MYSIRNKTRLRTFLQKCYTQLLQCLSGIANVQPVTYHTTIAYKDEHDDLVNHYEKVSFNDNFHTIGRQGTIAISNYRQSLSRIHAMLCVVTHQDGRQLVVVLDWWSLYGTTIAGTTHCSLPDDRRVLIAPADQTFVLELGVLQSRPLTVVVNAPECLICMERPRTELFETCGHLVACRPCLMRMFVDKSVIDCPVCRDVVSLQTTHTAQYELGEYHTCCVESARTDNSALENEMDALQSTVYHPPLF